MAEITLAITGSKLGDVSVSAEIADDGLTEIMNWVTDGLMRGVGGLGNMRGIPNRADLLNPPSVPVTPQQAFEAYAAWILSTTQASVQAFGRKVITPEQVPIALKRTAVTLEDGLPIEEAAAPAATLAKVASPKSPRQ